MSALPLTPSPGVSHRPVDDLVRHRSSGRHGATHAGRPTCRGGRGEGNEGDRVPSRRSPRRRRTPRSMSPSVKVKTREQRQGMGVVRSRPGCCLVVCWCLESRSGPGGMLVTYTGPDRDTRSDHRRTLVFVVSTLIPSSTLSSHRHSSTCPTYTTLPPLESHAKCFVSFRSSKRVVVVTKNDVIWFEVE